MTDAEITEHSRRAREEQARFFSNPAKPECERWVVAEFLKTLAVSFSDDELLSQNESDDIDVVFRDANFKIKELSEPNCRRSFEVRDDLKRAETATNLWNSFARWSQPTSCMKIPFLQSNATQTTLGIRPRRGRNSICLCM